MRTRLLTAGLVLGTGALGLVPVASAATTTTADVHASPEAWYQLNPTCSTPAGCQAPPAAPALPAPPVPLPAAPVPLPVSTDGSTTAYPAGTLHVAVSAGTETARTVLGLPAALADGTATAATLQVPLDVDAADGSLAPDTAKLLVCLTKAPVTSVEGSLAAPPTTDCSAVAPLAYAATPQPHLQADLAPLLRAVPSATGLVLLPDRARLTTTDAWHVVFSSSTRDDAAKTGPAVLHVTSTRPDAPAVPAAPAAPAAAPAALALAPAAALPAAEPELGGAPAVAGQAPALADDSAAVLAPAANTVALSGTVRVGYAYPAVWLVPLGLLVLVPLVARALTADLTPRSPADEEA